MAKQRMVNTRFWSDPFVQSLTIEEKLFYLYLITNEHTEINGAYEISLKTMSAETDIPVDRLSDILIKLSSTGKVAYKDDYVILFNFSKYQGKAPGVLKGIEIANAKLPQAIKETLERGGVEPSRTPVEPVPNPHFNLNLNSNLNSNLNLKVADGRTPKKKISVQAPHSTEVEEIILFFEKKFDTKVLARTHKRIKLLKERIASLGKEAIIEAIEGFAGSPWHRGENSTGWKANLDFIIKSDEQIEKGINLKRPVEQKRDIRKLSNKELLEIYNQQELTR